MKVPKDGHGVKELTAEFMWGQVALSLCWSPHTD